jgi:ABC-type bacteriocin/lantibiotic exporter with double-glycine peptidase domain
MVLAFCGVQVSEAELSRLIRKTRAGTPVLNIELLAHVGFGVSVESGAFDAEQLKQFLDDGCPIIVAVMTGPLSYWKTDRRHSVVVVGYDDKSVYLNDPKFSDAPWRVSWEAFLAAWEEFGWFGAVIRGKR